jgi:predicted ABC-type ATPase
MATPPQAVILAGPNGAGKTTAAKGLLPSGIEYVNADIIAQRLTGRSDAPGEMEAMRIELAEIERLVAARQSFAVETTLAPKAFEKRIIQWRANGYEIVLLFMCLPSADMAIQRVLMRVANGGHAVPEEVIRRRFDEGLRNFFRRYRSLVDVWEIFDNAGGPATPIARGTVDGILIHDFLKWTTLEERYGIEH